MSLSARSKDALRGWIPYRLTRVDRQSKPAAAKVSAPPATAKKKAGLPGDFDDEGKKLIRQARPWTMTSPDKLYALILATRYVARHKIAGDIVECGVWRGGSMQVAARTLMECGDTGRHLYLFDTFEGMTDPTEEDVRRDGQSAAELLAAQPKTSGVWAVASLEDVQDGMSQTHYPSSQIHYVKGRVEDTTPAEAPDQIAILRLDTDWYASTKHELETLYTRLSPGGVLLIDDYGWWQGARKAVDDWLEQTNEPLLLLRMAEGRVAVKPR
jgi:O-methyltransferase